MIFRSKNILTIIPVILVILTFQFTIYGQTDLTIVPTIAIGSLDIERIKTYDLDYDEIKGSPYLEKNMLTGHVVMIDHKTTNELSLNYDIYSDEFFYENNKNEELVFDLKLVRAITMKGKDEDYLFKRANPRTPHKFYEILYESETLDIYNDVQINFKDGRDNGVIKTDPKFSRDDNYYAVVKGEKPKSIKLKKKNIYKLFDNDEQITMDRILSEHKIKLKKTKDYKRLFKALNK